MAQVAWFSVNGAEVQSLAFGELYYVWRDRSGEFVVGGRAGCERGLPVAEAIVWCGKSEGAELDAVAAAEALAAGTIDELDIASFLASRHEARYAA